MISIWPPEHPSACRQGSLLVCPSSLPPVHPSACRPDRPSLCLPARLSLCLPPPASLLIRSFTRSPARPLVRPPACLPRVRLPPDDDFPAVCGFRWRPLIDKITFNDTSIITRTANIAIASSLTDYKSHRGLFRMSHVQIVRWPNIQHPHLQSNGLFISRLPNHVGITCNKFTFRQFIRLKTLRRIY